MGFKVTVVPPFTVHGELVSGTRIRQLLADGRVDEVIDLLGKPYCVFGEVVERRRYWKADGYTYFKY